MSLVCCLVYWRNEGGAGLFRLGIYYEQEGGNCARRSSVLVAAAVLFFERTSRLICCRFIPTRDGTDLHASYQLLSEHGGVSGSEMYKGRRRKSFVGQGTDVEARKGEFRLVLS